MKELPFPSLHIPLSGDGIVINQQERPWFAAYDASKLRRRLGLPQPHSNALGIAGAAQSIYDKRGPFFAKLVRCDRPTAPKEPLVLSPELMPVASVVDECFPDQSNSWREAVSNQCSGILCTIAEIQLRHKQNQADRRSNQNDAQHNPTQQSDALTVDPNYKIVALLRGSMARTGLGGLSERSRKSHETLMAAKRNFAKSDLSPIAKAVLNTTGRFDMDISVFPGVSVEELFAKLAGNSTIVSRGVYRDANITLASRSGERPARATYFVTDNGVGVMKLIFSPLHGADEFSVDITDYPRTTAQRKGDERETGQSVKRPINICVVAKKNAQDEIDVGFAENPVNLLKKIDTSTFLSHILGIDKHSSFTQLVLATLAMIRIEAFSTESEIIERIMDYEISWHKETLDSVWKEADGCYPTPKQAKDIARECVVSLSSFKDEFIRLFRSLGLDKYFGNTQALRRLEKMDQDKLCENLKNDASFFEYVVNEFNLSKDVSNVEGTRQRSRHGKHFSKHTR